MRLRWVALAVVVVGLAAWAAWAVLARRVRAELAAADREIAAHRYSAARGRLIRLASGHPYRDEALYRLGECELALGHRSAAESAWARVPRGSALSGRVDVARAKLLADRGRFAEAEDLMRGALDANRSEAGPALMRLLKAEGRFDEAAELIRRDGPGIDALRDLWSLDRNSFTGRAARKVLEDARRDAPDDHRAILGLARMELRAGRLDAADRLLSDCQRRRPDDPVAWRARLDWARAADDPAAARSALAHLPPGSLRPGEGWSLRAWLASRRGDVDAEHAALSERVSRPPADPAALGRLAELDEHLGHPETARSHRQQKARLDAAIARYHHLLFFGDPSAHLAELGRLAESLGRPSDARGWWTLRAKQAPADAVATAALSRLRDEVPPRDPGPTPAELLADAAPPRRADRPTAQVTVPQFVDDAEAVGLRFTYEPGLGPDRPLPATMGGGVGLLDYDGDGWLDVYCVQGGPFPPHDATNRDHLFRNKGDGTFEDASESAGLAKLRGGYGHGVAVGDIDNDGRPDLFVTRWNAYALYRNRGDGTFEDVTEPWNLAGNRDWPTSAAFADLDGDGDLDLYVCHYLAWDGNDAELGPRRGVNPLGYRARPDHLFRNDGDRFVDVTEAAGINDRDGRGLGVVAGDLDADGRLDLFVANDMTANFLFRNLGGLRFEERGPVAGVASNANGGYQAGMGIACADADGDGRPDLAVTNFYGEGTSLFRNIGHGLFVDRSAESGLAPASRTLLGFGAAFLDADDDGWPDLATANGHVDDLRPGLPYEMSMQLLQGGPGGRLVDVSARAGACWSVPRLGRGLAVGDLDNDGRLDLVALPEGSPLAYLHNKSSGGRSLSLRLEGGASGRDAVGARVAVGSGGRRHLAWKVGGGSYQSASDGRIHVGLGAVGTAVDVEVAWPSGAFGRARLAPGHYRWAEGGEPAEER